MVAFTDMSARNALDALIGSYPYLALFTTVGIDAGTSFVEAAYTGYARVTTVGLWSAAAGSTPATKTNNATITFATTGSTGLDVIGWGLYDALTAGNLGFWEYLGNYDWKPITYSATTPSLLTQPAHGYVNTDKLVATSEFGVVGPIAMSGLQTVANATADTFNLTGVNSTGTGSLMMRKVVPQGIVAGLSIRFTAGQLIIKL